MEILDQYGVRKESSRNFLERFDTSYVNEVQEFVNCILNNRKPSITAQDGTKVTEIAYKCREAFETGQLLKFEH